MFITVDTVLSYLDIFFFLRVSYKSIVIIYFCNVEYEQIVLQTGHMFHGILKNRDGERYKDDIDTIYMKTKCRPTLRC